ncbi:hypothetical protein JYT44_02920 [Caldithrix abyssi]|nr:hypothetical protein [Caldithrix abyssi]
MKKILLWSGMLIGLFVLLVGLTFAYLSYDSSETEVLITPESAKSTEVEAKVLIKQSEIDTLDSQILDLKSQFFFSGLKVDSLNEQLSFKDAMIEGYKKEIQNLNDTLLALNQQKGRIKELAKTYESMKPNEMKPILANLEDEIIMVIYNQMSSRSRKLIFQALEKKRAAEITKKLAGLGEKS